MELTILLFLPALGATLVLLLPQSQEHQARYIALLVSLGALGVSLWLFVDFDNDASGFQYVVQETWVEAAGFDLEYHLGLDGLSMPLVVLTTVLTVASVLVSFSVTRRERAYYASLLLLSTSVLGVFMALDFMLFFLFWELELFPMYLLIAVWGSGRREYSAMKFVLFTIAGSAFMLVGILALAVVLALVALTFAVLALALILALTFAIVALALVIPAALAVPGAMLQSSRPWLRISSHPWIPGLAHVPHLLCVFLKRVIPILVCLIAPAACTH